MNSLDLTIILIMSVAVTISTFRGGVRELFSLAAVIIGFIFAAHYYKYTSENFIRLTSHPSVNNIIAFLAIYIFAAVLVSFIGGRVTHMVKKSKLNALDHILGTVVGSLKGIVVCSLIVYALMVFLPAKSKVFTESKAFPYMSQLSEAVSPIGPQFFRDEFGKKLEEIKSGDKKEQKKRL